VRWVLEKGANGRTGGGEKEDYMKNRSLQGNGT